MKVSRRQFLWSTTALGAIALVGLPTEALPQTISKTLDVQLQDDVITYNGKTPGETIRMSPGDTLDVTLINSMPPLHDDCTDTPNQFHGRHTTNLHTHGLHVSPTTDSSGQFDADNVFVSLVPKDQFVPCEDLCGDAGSKYLRYHQTQYRFEIADNHPSGTFWYHAHKHGATAMQVGAGLAGPLIVDDLPGAMPDYIAEAEEKIFMIMNNGIVLVDPSGGGTWSPTLTMRPGEV